MPSSPALAGQGSNQWIVREMVGEYRLERVRGREIMSYFKGLRNLIAEVENRGLRTHSFIDKGKKKIVWMKIVMIT